MNATRRSNPGDCFQGQNFMTPRIIRYGWLRKWQIAYELSEGEDFDRKVFYGVTVRDADQNQPKGLGKCFNEGTQAERLAAAEAYIVEVRAKLAEVSTDD